MSVYRDTTPILRNDGHPVRPNRGIRARPQIRVNHRPENQRLPFTVQVRPVEGRPREYARFALADDANDYARSLVDRIPTDVDVFLAEEVDA